MQIMKVDPRALKENPDRMRQSKSSPQGPPVHAQQAPPAEPCPLQAQSSPGSH